MASISRIVSKDCKLQKFEGLSFSLPARRVKTNLSIRGGIGVPESGIGGLAIQNKAQNSVLTVSASSLFNDSFESGNGRFCCKAAANVSGDLPSSSPGGMSQYERIIETLTTLFPVWVILGTIIGIYKPSMVTWLETDLFTVGLGFLMLSMGLTLTFEDFKRCLRNPWTVGVGFLAQYLIKPILGFFIAMDSCV